MSRCDCRSCEEDRQKWYKEQRIFKEKCDKTFRNIFNAVKIWIAMQKAFEMGYLKGKITLRQWQNRE